MDKLIWLVPVIAIVALVYALMMAQNIKKQSQGTDKMKEIASAIKEGAQAFLFAEYKILVIFVVVLFVLIGFASGWGTAVCFLVGALFSTAAGYVGMNVATDANVRTANAAKESGMAKALSIAYKGGSVMGLCVVGLGLAGVSLIYLITRDADILFG